MTKRHSDVVTRPRDPGRAADAPRPTGGRGSDHATRPRNKEADLTQALIQFCKEHLGRGPEVSQVHVHKDLVVFRCCKVLPPHELALVRGPSAEQASLLVKRMRRELLETQADRLKAVVSAVVGVPVVSLHHDLSTTADECVIVLTLGRR